MKVLLLNGSPREHGCTYTALTEVAASLNKEGIETFIFHAGVPTIDNIKKAATLMKECDGLVLGSPVYWASPSGEMLQFMDKFAAFAKNDLAFKPGAVVTSARRAGTTATLDVLMKYLSYHQMPIVSSNYWTMVHGNTPDEVRQDTEGMQIMHILGKNMAWLLKCIENGKVQGIALPEQEEKIKMNFIR